MRRILPLLLLFSLCLSSNAATLAGSEITYRSLDSFKFEISYTIYRNCSGISLGNPSTVCKINSSCGSRSLNLRLISIEDITPINEFAAKRCVPLNGFGTGNGFERHVYRDTFDLNDSANIALKGCCTIRAELLLCCRHSGYNTIQGSNTIYNTCEIDICKAPTNTSPTFRFDPHFWVIRNQATHINPGCTDTTDGDSLSFKIINARVNVSNNVGNYSTNCGFPVEVYIPGNFNCNSIYTNTAPPIGFYFDTKTGQTIFTPTDNDISWLSIEVTEWRKDSTGTYRKIGAVTRDMDLSVLNSNNIPPQIFGNTNYEICQGEQLCFDMTTYDATYVPPPPASTPPPDTVTVSWDGGIPQGSFSVPNPSARLQTGRFCWTPTEDDVRDKPYYFTIEARDNGDLLGITQKSISIRVKPKAKASIVVDSLACGYLYCSASPDTDFVGSPFYKWSVLDSSGQPLSPGLYRFTSTTDPKSGLQNDSLKIKKAGTFIIQCEVKNSPYNCATYVRDTVRITHAFSVSFNKVSDTICLNRDFDLVPTLANKQDPVAYAWFIDRQPSANKATMNLNMDSLYGLRLFELRALSADGCSDLAFMNIASKGTIIADMPDTLRSCDDTIHISLQTSLDSILWSNALTDTFDLSISSTTTLSYQAFDSYGCAYADSSEILVFKTIPIDLKDSAICDDSVLVSPSHSYTSYQWSTGSTSKEIVLYSATTISLEVEDSNGCVLRDTATYKVFGTPGLNLAPDSVLCCGADLIPLLGLLGSKDPKTGKWTCTTHPGSITSTLFDPNDLCSNSPVSAYLTYYFQSTVTGCEYRDSVHFTVNPSTGIQMKQGDFCQADEEISLETQILILPASAGHIQEWTCESCNGNNFANMLTDRGTLSDPNFYLLIDTAHYKVMNQTTDRVRIRLSYTNVYACESTDTTSIRISKTPEKPILRKDGEAITITNPSSTIRWYRDGSLLSDQDSMVDASTFGTYVAQNVNEAGCESSFSNPIARTAGITGPEVLNIHIVPNPSNGKVQIVLSENLENSDIEVRMLNLTGQEIHTESNVTGGEISLNWEGPAGVYYLEIQLNGTVYRTMVIKN